MVKYFHTSTDAALVDYVTAIDSVPKDRGCRKNWDKSLKAKESYMAIEEIHKCLFFIQ